MTPSGLSVSPYARLKPAIARQSQPAATHKALYFGASAAEATGEDKLEKSDALKTDEELEEEEEERIRKLAEARIDKRYSAEDIATLDKRNPAKRKTLIEEKVQEQRGWVKDKGNFLKENNLAGVTKNAVEEAIQRLKDTDKEHHAVYKEVYGELLKLKPSAVIEPHYIQQQALIITDAAIEHPKDKKGELVEAEMERIKKENEPSWIARPAVYLRDGLTNFAQNSYFTAKDTYKTTIGATQYAAKKGAQFAQDGASVVGTGYLSQHLSQKANNYLGLPPYLSWLPPAAVGLLVAPALGTRQKNSFAAGAAFHHLGNTAGKMSVYGIPVQTVAHGASALVASSALIPNAAYSSAWNNGKSIGGQAASLMAWPFVKAASLFSRTPKTEQATEQLVQEKEMPTVSEERDEIAQPEEIKPPQEDKKPASTSGKSRFSLPSVSWFSSKTGKAAPLATETAQTEEEIQAEIEADLKQKIAVSHGDPKPPASPTKKEGWSILPNWFSKTAKPAETTSNEVEKAEEAVTHQEEAATVVEPDIKQTEEKQEVQIAAEKAAEPVIAAPVSKPKKVAPVADTKEVEEVVAEKPKAPPVKKPETKQKEEKTVFQRYAWPTVHVAAGSSLIAGGALLHLPVITAPIGMGMMAAGSAWAIYGVYKGFQAAKS